MNERKRTSLAEAMTAGYAKLDFVREISLFEFITERVNDLLAAVSMATRSTTHSDNRAIRIALA
jgi:hypothetical protein